MTEPIRPGVSTPDAFAEAVRRLVSDAEEEGLDRETLLAVVDDMCETTHAILRRGNLSEGRP